MKKEVFTTFEISQILQVNPTTVQNWAKNGMLQAYTTPGGHRRVRKADLIKFIEEYNFPFPDELKEERQSVLIVDDEAMVLETITKGIKYFAKGDWDILTASNGMDALLILGDRKPDLIILDIWLPDMDGFEVCRRIKEREPGIGVISISGALESEQIKRIQETGADYFLSKPLKMEELIKVMEEITNER